MSQESQRYLHEVYQRIKAEKERYGRLRKTLFHIHTPFSYDFSLCEEWSVEKYKSASNADIEEYCKKMKVFPEGLLLDNIGRPNNLIDLYADEKQWLSFMAIAKVLVTEEYELVVVTDHNKIGAASLLKKAIEDVKQYHADKPYTEVLCGVEISCADKLHVVGIYDEKVEKEIKQWLEEGLISEREGTFYTSLQVIEFIHNQDGIAYIAHLNSANLFDGQRYLSGAYKKKLIADDVFGIVGVHSYNQMDKLGKKLREEGVKSFNFVIDNDAHSCEKLSENYFWLKASKLNFRSVYEALEDFDVSVQYINNQEKKKYISGLFVEPKENSFLKGKTSNSFVMKFSDSLNCFIGGRGTGKSTVLQLLDFSLSARVDDVNMLDFLCQHGNVWVLFYTPASEYLIKMALPQKGDCDNILCRYGQNPANLYHFRYTFDQEEVMRQARRYQTIYQVVHDERGLFFNKLLDPKGHIEQLYDTRYSINKLVQTAGSEEITTFIYNLMLKNKNIVSAESAIRARSIRGLDKTLSKIQETLRERKKNIECELSTYNKRQKNLLQIKYSQDNTPQEPNIKKWIAHGHNLESGFKGWNITTGNAVEYAYYIYEREGLIPLFRYAFQTPGFSRYKYSVRDFLKKPELANEEEEHTIIDSIFEELISEENLTDILTYLKQYVSDIEELTLEFNVNSKTSSNNKAAFKDVRKLSLGQKVVAMLDFILSYGTYIGDDRPILLDQPEDNLDSQYIYKNLVKQLREVKNERQIIIATHSATIVTNSMTDQVCLMCSDGEHGWIEKSGYPSEPIIKKHIVNYLEGGIESFKHKQKLYASVLE